MLYSMVNMHNKRKRLVQKFERSVQNDCHSKKASFVAIVAIFLAFALSANVVLAATRPTEEQESSSENQTASEYYESQEYKDSVEETNRAIDNYLASTALPRSSSAMNLNVTLIKQEKNWYCSFACLEMVLEYLTSTDYKQDDIVAEMGLNGSPFLYQVTNYLNQELGAGSYQQLTIEQYPFANSMPYSINKNKPVICLVVPDVLPNYGSTGNGGHYIVVKGYYVAFSGSSSTAVCMYNDPHYSQDHYGTFTCEIETMEEALADHPEHGWYIRGAN